MIDNSFKNNKKEKRTEISQKPEAMVESEIDKLKRGLKECQKKAEEYLNGWKRTQADFINYKNRQSQLMQEWVEMANENLIFQLLPILDSIDTALKNKPKSPDGQVAKWTEGISKISEQFFKILKAAGLEEIKSVGEKFNPEFHEAVDVARSDKEDGFILGEVQKGYKLHDKVIRTAKVRVSTKNKKTGAEDPKL